MTMNKLEECARALAGTFWDDQPHDYMPDDAKKRAKQREYFVTDNWSQWLPDARLPPSDDRADLRSKTPQGFARAVFQANAPKHLRAAA